MKYLNPLRTQNNSSKFIYLEGPAGQNAESAELLQQAEMAERLSVAAESNEEMHTMLAVALVETFGGQMNRAQYTALAAAITLPNGEVITARELKTIVEEGLTQAIDSGLATINEAGIVSSVNPETAPVVTDSVEALTLAPGMDTGTALDPAANDLLPPSITTETDTVTTLTNANFSPEALNSNATAQLEAFNNLINQIPETYRDTARAYLVQSAELYNFDRESGLNEYEARNFLNAIEGRSDLIASSETVASALETFGDNIEDILRVVMALEPGQVDQFLESGLEQALTPQQLVSRARAIGILNVRITDLKAQTAARDLNNYIATNNIPPRGTEAYESVMREHGLRNGIPERSEDGRIPEMTLAAIEEAMFEKRYGNLTPAYRQATQTLEDMVSNRVDANTALAVATELQGTAGEPTRIALEAYGTAPVLEESAESLSAEQLRNTETFLQTVESYRPDLIANVLSVRQSINQNNYAQVQAALQTIVVALFHDNSAFNLKWSNDQFISDEIDADGEAIPQDYSAEAIMNDPSAMIQALREMRDTTSAGQEASRLTREGLVAAREAGGDINATEEALLARYSEALAAPNASQQAEENFANMMQSIQRVDPIFAERMLANQDTIVANMTQDLVFMTVLDEHIATNGSDDLGSLLAMYDDMKGLYGTLNFTDENAAMTRELIIFAAGFMIPGAAIINASGKLVGGAARLAVRGATSIARAPVAIAARTRGLRGLSAVDDIAAAMARNGDEAIAAFSPSARIAAGGDDALRQMTRPELAAMARGADDIPTIMSPAPFGTSDDIASLGARTADDIAENGIDLATVMRNPNARILGAGQYADDIVRQATGSIDDIAPVVSGGFDDVVRVGTPIRPGFVGAADDVPTILGRAPAITDDLATGLRPPVTAVDELPTIARHAAPNEFRTALARAVPDRPVMSLSDEALEGIQTAARTNPARLAPAIDDALLAVDDLAIQALNPTQARSILSRVPGLNAASRERMAQTLARATQATGTRATALIDDLTTAMARLSPAQRGAVYTSMVASPFVAPMITDTLAAALPGTAQAEEAPINNGSPSLVAPASLPDLPIIDTATAAPLAPEAEPELTLTEKIEAIGASELRSQATEIRGIMEKYSDYQLGQWENIADEIATLYGLELTTEAERISFGNTIQARIRSTLGLPDEAQNLDDGKIGPASLQYLDRAMMSVGESEIIAQAEDLQNFEAQEGGWRNNNRAMAALFGIDFADNATDDQLKTFGRSIQAFAGGNDGAIGTRTIARMNENLAALDTA